MHVIGERCQPRHRGGIRRIPHHGRCRPVREIVERKPGRRDADAPLRISCGYVSSNNRSRTPTPRPDASPWRHHKSPPTGQYAHDLLRIKASRMRRIEPQTQCAPNASKDGTCARRSCAPVADEFVFPSAQKHSKYLITSPCPVDHRDRAHREATAQSVLSRTRR